MSNTDTKLVDDLSKLAGLVRPGKWKCCPRCPSDSDGFWRFNGSDIDRRYEVDVDYLVYYAVCPTCQTLPGDDNE